MAKNEDYSWRYNIKEQREYTYKEMMDKKENPRYKKNKAKIFYDSIKTKKLLTRL